jgi:hypothetical protein
MTREESVRALKDQQEQTAAAVALYERATVKAADSQAREKQVAEWAASRRAAGKIVRPAEEAEVLRELEAQAVEKRRTEAATLREHRTRLQAAITAAEHAHETLEPTWAPLMRHQQGGDYAIAMLRQADEHALARVEAQLADWTQAEIWTAYQRALEAHDDVMLRAIEAQGWRRSATGKPTDADSASLFNLQRAIKAARVSRHPVEATAAREFLATLPGGVDKSVAAHGLTLVADRQVA